jgi:hypothetical protein
MKAIVKKPGEKSETIEIDKGDSLKALQGLVGGYITTVWDEGLDEAGITAWANDEGLLIGQAPNLFCYGQPIVGPVVFTGHNDEGETIARHGPPAGRPLLGAGPRLRAGLSPSRAHSGLARPFHH